MQSKGAIRFLAIIIGLACIFQLSFTLVTASVEKKAAKSAEAAVVAAQQSDSFSEVSAYDQAFYLDAVRTDANKQYLDSVRNEKVFFGYTYKDVKEKEINLGLDLKGGMNVTLQLDLAELVRSCARTKTTAEFNDVMALAKAQADQSHEDFISLFAEIWAEKYPTKQMYFDIDVSKLSGDTKNKVNPSNDEIIRYLQEEAESAIDNSYTVVERRVNQFGVAQPNIQKIARTGRILVELPGVKEPERVRKLLQGTASLEFWQTYTYQEILPFLQEVNAAAREKNASEKVDGEVVDVKSASPRSFAKFFKGTLIEDDPFGYLAQIASYDREVGKGHPAFLVMNKVNGELCLYKPNPDFDLPDTEMLIAECKAALAKDEPPITIALNRIAKLFFPKTFII